MFFNLLNLNTVFNICCHNHSEFWCNVLRTSWLNQKCSSTSDYLSLNFENQVWPFMRVWVTAYLSINKSRSLALPEDTELWLLMPKERGMPEQYFKISFWFIFLLMCFSLKLDSGRKTPKLLLKSSLFCLRHNTFCSNFLIYKQFLYM